MDTLAEIWPLALTALLAYLLGSIPFGLIVTRAAGLGDVRKIGSGNIGATNVLRTGHKGLAALTLALDAGKGVAAVLLASAYGGETYLIVAALAVMLGHMFPVWLGFRGGKAVATGLGIMLGMAWPAAIAGFATWLVIVVLTRLVSLAGIISAILSIAYMWVFTENIHFAWTMAVLAALVVFRHRANIGRLLRGEEPKIGQR